LFVGYWAQRLWWYAFGVQEQVTFCCFEFGMQISVSKPNGVLRVCRVTFCGNHAGLRRD